MRKSLAFNKILAFALVMVMVIIMIPTHFFPQAADDDTPRTSNMFIRSGDVSVEGNLQRGTTLAASKVADPFTSAALRSSTKSLNGAIRSGASVNGNTPAPVSDDPEIFTYSQLNYLGFYDISLRKGGAEIQPDGTVKVTIKNDSFKEVDSVKVLHILDKRDTISKAVSNGSGLIVRDKKFVSAFPEQSALAESVLGLDNIVVIEFMDASLNSDTITFNTNSFSIYAITDDEGNDLIVPRREYIFLNATYADDGTIAIDGNGNDIYEHYYFYDKAGHRVFNQIVKNGEFLEEVTNPDTTTRQSFAGWYEVTYDPETGAITEWTNNKIEFEEGNEITGITGNTEVQYIAAKYKKAYFLAFHEYVYGHTNNGTYDYDNIITRIRVDVLSGETVSVDLSNYTASALEGGRIFAGWATITRSDKLLDYDYSQQGDVKYITVNDEGQTVSQLIEVSNADIDLYPIFSSAHWLRFVSGPIGSGASYIPARYVIATTDLSKFSVPSRLGYTFVGWCYENPESPENINNQDSITPITDAEGNVRASEIAHLKELLENNDVVLYGKWSGNPVNYTVVIWQENADDDRYSFVSSETRTAAAGSIAGVSAPAAANGFHLYASDLGNYPTETNQKYVLKEDTVNGDGSTIINVYYNRNVYQILFYRQGQGYTYTLDNTNGTYGLVNGQYVELIRGDGTTIITITKRYVYSQTTNTNSTYGIVNNEYIPLTSHGNNNNNRYYTYNTGNYVYTVSNSNSTGYYYLPDGNGGYEYVYLYRNNNNRWYRNREWNWGWNYYDEYTGLRYTREEETITYTGTRYTRANSNESYTGTRYIKSGNTYVVTTSNSNDPQQYYLDSNNAYVELNITESSGYEWYYTDANNVRHAYSGDRYRRTAAGNNTYGIIEDLTISAKYGADIADQWPGIKPGTESYSVLWYMDYPQTGYYADNHYVNGAQTMPLGGDEHYYVSGGSYYHNDRYYFQSVNGGNVFDSYVDHPFTFSGWLITSAEDYKPIKGFTINADSQSDANAIRQDTNGDPNATYNANFNRSASIRTSYENQPQQTVNGRQYHTVNYYYLRNQYNIVFFSNGVQVNELEQTGIYYGASLASYEPSNYIVGETRGEDSQHRPAVFMGWYDNEACMGEPFDFGSNMPAGNITLYAKWQANRYQVKLYPEYGEVKGENESLYFKLDYGEKVQKYTIYRDYVEDPEGEYYYFIYGYDQNQAFGIDEYDNGNRKSYYITQEQYDSLTEEQKQCVDTSKRYKKELGVYSFIDWYRVNEQGEESDEPFNFEMGAGEDSDSPEYNTSDITLVARWRKVGTYNIIYNPSPDSENHVGGYMDQVNDNGYADKAETTILNNPTDVTPGYVFKGWKVVDDDGNDIDNGTLYHKGDKFVVKSEHANSNKLITLIAVYEKVEESDEPVSVTKIVFDSNYPEDTGMTQVTFGEEGLQINRAYNLFDLINGRVTESYIPDGYVLIGWSTNKNCDPHDPTASAGFFTLHDPDVVIGIDNLSHEMNTDINTLYAIWARVFSVTVAKEVVIPKVSDATNFINLVNSDFYNGIDFEITPNFSTTVADGSTPFDLQHGGSKTFDEVGELTTFTMVETADNRFNTSYVVTYLDENNQKVEVQPNADGRYLVDHNLTVTIKNTLKVNTFTVKKVVSNNLLESDLTKKFSISVAYAYTNETNNQGESTVELANNDSVLIEVPSGAKVNVTEDAGDAFEMVLSSTGVSANNDGSYTISADGSVITVTNTRKTIDVKVIKTVEEPSSVTAADFTFVATATVDGQKVILNASAEGDAKYQFTFTLNKTNGATGQVITLPAGSILTVKEVANNNYNTYLNGATTKTEVSGGYVTYESPTALTENTTVTFRNVRLVKVSFVKYVDNLGITSGLPTWTNFVVNYNGTSVNVTGNDINAASPVETEVAVEYNTTVSFEEDLTVKATDETTAVGDIYNDTYDPESKSIVANAEDTLVTITNTLKTVKIIVLKETEDGATGKFKVKLTRTNGTGESETLTIDLADTDPKAVFEIPYGTTFELEEIIGEGQEIYSPTYSITNSNDGKLTQDSNTKVYTALGDGEITIRNMRNPINITVNKTVISEVLADLGTYTFNIMINGSVYDTIEIDVDDTTKTGTGTKQVPYGSVVTIVEVGVDGENAFTVNSSFGSKTGDTTIELGQLTAVDNTVEFTNERNVVTVTVTKTVNNFSETASFPFAASWTIGDQTVTLTNALPNTNGNSWAFTVPYGATVSVEELTKVTNNGNEEDVTVTINGNAYKITEAFDTTYAIGTATAQTGYVAVLGEVKAAQTVEFVNTRKNVEVTLIKELNNKGVTDVWSTFAFPIKYQVVDGTATAETAQWIIPEYETGKYGVPAGETGVTVTVPFGAIVNVDEDTTAKPAGINHTIAETFKVTYAPAEKTAVAANTDNATVFTVTNVRNTVKVKLVKNVLSDDSSDFDGTTTYNFTVTTAVQALNGTHAIIIGESKTGYVEIEIPYGTDISFKETGIDAQKFDTFVAIDNNGALKQLTSALTDVIDEHTVTYTNRKILTVTVNKIVVSGLAADFTSYPFAISYYDIDGKLTTNVVVPGSNGQNRSVSVNSTGVAGETPITFKVPYGTTNLIVDEVLGAAAGSFRTALDITGAAGRAGDNNQSVTVDTVNVDTTITFTNTRNMQTITVEKTVDSLLAADLKAYTFTYGYKYFAASGEQTVADGTIDVTVSSDVNPATATFEIPYDAHAFEISEPDNSGTTTVLTTVNGTGSLANGTASDANRKYAVTANITADGKVSFTNKRVVYVTVRKILDSLDSGNDFTFEYSYTYKDTEVKQQITIEDVPVDTTGKAYAPVIEIPYGVEVTVKETTTEGYSTYVVVPYGTESQDTAVSGSATITSGTEAKPEEFVFTNHRVVPLKVTKVVDSEEPSDKVTIEYAFTVTYNYAGASGNGRTAFTIIVDEMLFGDNTVYVPYGATNVVITETPVDGYDTVAVSKTEGVTGTNTGSDYVKNVFTITGALEKAATVEFTNTRMVEVTVIKELDSEETYAMTKTFNFNYTYTGATHNTASAQAFTITMPNALTGKTVIRVPYGVKLTVNELINQTDYDTYYGFNGGATGTAGTTAAFADAIVDNNSSVKFSNKRMVNVKFIKNVDDPALSTENNKYTFTYTYTYNNTANTPDPVTITVDTTSATGNTGYFRIPYNAANFVVTETIDLSDFDVTASSTGTSGTLNGAAYTLSQNVTAVNTDITFNNQRMVEVEVVKVVESSEQADKTAPYSVTYGYTRAATGNIAAAVNVTGQTGTIKDAEDGKLTVRMPYGSTFTVTETGDLSAFQVLYSTTDNTALTEGKEVTLANVTEAKTVTFTNRKLYTVTVTKTVDNKNVNDGLQNAAFPFTYTVSNTVGYNVPATDNNGEFALTNNGAAKVITVPYGAKVVVSETTGAKINTLVAEVYDNTNYTVADFFTTSAPLTLDSVSANTTYEFSNVRKTREITVEKTLDSQVAADFHAYTFNWAVANWTSDAMTLTPVTQNVAVSDKVIVPVGLQVTVTEDNTKPSASAFVGMDTTVAVGNGEAAEGYTGTVPAGLENVTVYFVNSRVTADLTITKTIDGDISAHVPALENRTFMFRITASKDGYTYDRIVMIKGAGSVTITQLQTGYTYTVTEITDWSYEFDASGAYYAPLSDPTAITDNNKDDAVTFVFIENGEAVFSNAANDTNWLRGEAYADNRFYPNQK